MTPSAGEITLLLSELEQGNPVAADKLMPLVYEQLRKIAANHFRHERAGHTLQPTEVVHEAWLRFAVPGRVRWKNRSHFYAIASKNMRQILVEYARAHNAEIRGGRQQRVELDEARFVYPLKKPGDLVALDEALTRLEELDRMQAQIVELRYFAGLSVKETAQMLGLKISKVKWEWNLAKAFLRRELENTP